jgi:hypothetical protein
MKNQTVKKMPNREELIDLLIEIFQVAKDSGYTVPENLSKSSLMGNDNTASEEVTEVVTETLEGPEPIFEEEHISQEQEESEQIFEDGAEPTLEQTPSSEE